MTKIQAEDIVQLYQLAWEQFKEDREAIIDQYKDLKAYIADNNDRYAISGDTLAKYSELMVKQTSQIVELIKLAKKDKEDSFLSTEDYDAINEEIENEKKENK